MTKVNIHEAKTNFSRLVERALAGEEIVIARGGRTLLKLVPLEGAGTARPIGLHRRTVGDDFERRSLEPLTNEDLAAWERPDLEMTSNQSQRATSRLQTFGAPLDTH